MRSQPPVSFERTALGVPLWVAHIFTIGGNPALVHLHRPLAARLVRQHDRPEGRLEHVAALRKAGRKQPHKGVLNDEPGVLDGAGEPVMRTGAAKRDEETAGT